MANWLPLAVAGAALPTVTYIGAVTPSLAGQVATATNANIGTASADRLVVVVFFDINETSTSAPATVTIGGTSATVHIFQTGAANNVMGICSLLVTSGTTATIAVTYSGAGSQGGGQFGIYNLNRLSSTTPVGTGGAWNNVVNPLSATLATSSGGIVIVGADDYAQLGGATVTFSGTETYTTDLNNASGGFDTGGWGNATNTAANASSTVTATWSAVNGHNVLAAVAWR